MSKTEENKQVARTFIDALSAGDIQGMLAVLDPNIKLNVMGKGCMGGSFSLKEFGGLAGALGAICPEGIKLEIRDMTAEEDRVSVRVDGFSKTSSGGEYNNNYHFLFKIRDGKIVESFEYMDTLLVENTFGAYMKEHPL